MQKYFMDLHIHIGASNKGDPVKITASRALTFANIVQESLEKKGIGIIGIVDCASPLVLEDIRCLEDSGVLIPIVGGGYRYQDQVTVLLGAEVESKEDSGRQAHFLAYFPTRQQIEEFSQTMSQYITNISLSSQMTYLPGREILKIVDDLGGIFIPAHSFTPHKSLYGSCATSLYQLFSDPLANKIKTIELGLSADSQMADSFTELNNRSFLSNSDAHSLGKIGREYNQIQVRKPDFQHIFRVLAGDHDAGKMLANYGLDPRLGKYYRSFCEDCQRTLTSSPPIWKCTHCGSEKITPGVWDRITAIRDRKSQESPAGRPPYYYQIPLADLPGIGPHTLERLIQAFGSEMNVLHRANFDELQQVVSKKISENIILARQGRMTLLPGGGGYYGRAVRSES